MEQDKGLLYARALLVFEVSIAAVMICARWDQLAESKTRWSTIDAIASTLVNAGWLFAMFVAAANWKGVRDCLRAELRKILLYVVRTVLAERDAKRSRPGRFGPGEPDERPSDARGRPPFSLREHQEEAMEGRRNRKMRQAVNRLGKEAVQIRRSFRRLNFLAIVIACLLAGITIGLAIFAVNWYLSRPVHKPTADDAVIVEPQPGVGAEEQTQTRNINGITCECGPSSATCELGEGLAPKDLVQKYYGEIDGAKADAIARQYLDQHPGRSDKQIPAGESFTLNGKCPGIETPQ